MLYPFRYATLYVIVSVCSFFFILLNGFKNSRDDLPRNDIRIHARSYIVTINEVDQNKSTLIELKLQNVHTHSDLSKHLNSQQTYIHTRTHAYKKECSIWFACTEWNEMKKRISRIVWQNHYHQQLNTIVAAIAIEVVSKSNEKCRICALSQRLIYNISVLL